jgi:membrane protease YdiL (CAAX protease family)
MEIPPPRSDFSPSRLNGRMRAACISYALLLLAFWFVGRHFANETHGHWVSGYAAFALLLAPYWFFGFCEAEGFRRVLTNQAVRVLVPSALLIPYLVFCLPRGEFRWNHALVIFGIPVGIAALFEFLPPGGEQPSPPKLYWQDVITLLLVSLPIEFGRIRGSFPGPGMNVLPKLLLLDSALYAFLVVRGLGGVGHDFRARTRDLLIGVREFGYLAPIAILVGLAIRFITPHAVVPPASSVLAALLVTLFFVAIPEELFFRGLLQNLLEPRVGYPGSLLAASVVFGLSHFNKPGPFNLRYVVLGTIAGVFYGRAWHDRRRVLASATTHAMVDVIWALWFR